jgi:hypothetical protein
MEIWEIEARRFLNPDRAVFACLQRSYCGTMHPATDIIRVKGESMTRVFQSSPREAWVSLAAALAGGTLFGAAAKFADTSAITGLGDLGTYLGVWVLLATLIAAWSPSRHLAALRVGPFMIAMVITYYLVTWWLFSAFPLRYFLAWAAAAVLLAPLFAVAVSLSRRTGWLPAAAAALPIALLLAEAFTFRWVLPRYWIQVLFDVAAAVMLFALLPRSGEQRLRVLAFIPPLLLAAIGLHRVLPWILSALIRIGLRI